MNELQALLVPLIAAGILGGLKVVFPALKDRIPNVLWPLAVFVIARIGTAMCGALEASCSGNPFQWSPETVQAFTAAFVAVVLREGSKSAKAGWPQLKDLLARANA